MSWLTPVRSPLVFLHNALLAPVRGLLLSASVGAVLASGCGPMGSGTSTPEQLGVSQQEASTSVTVYADGNYGGMSQSLAPGAYDIGELVVGNDTISSLKVPQGWKVLLYSDANYQGSVKTFTSDTTWVGDDFNDQTSSIKVIPPASANPYPQQIDGLLLNAAPDVESLKYEVASNPTVIYELAELANDLGYGWCGGTRTQYVGQDFDVSRTADGSYIMQAHYNSSDPYASGYWADKRLKITLSNFKLLIDPSTFSYGTPLTESLDPIAVAQSYASNSNTTQGTITVQLTDQHTDSVTHTTNYSFTEGLKVAIKNKAEVPLFGSSEVTTEFSFSATQGWSDATTTSNVTGITNTYATPVPAMSKKLVTMLGFRTSSRVSYSGVAYLSFNITFDGFLRNGGNARTDHPTNRPFVTTTFGNDTMSGLQDVLDKYDHRNIPNYSQWDWAWVNSFDGNTSNLMDTFRKGIAAPISGNFAGVKGTYTSFTEGPVQPL